MGRIVRGLVVAALLSSAARAEVLSASIPLAGPTGAALGSWEKITGDVETADEHVSYVLYVNPARAALYEVTRYQVTRHSTDGDGRRRDVSETEKFLWNAHPGTGELLRCFELLPGGSWVQMKTGSAEYRSEMATAIRVYGLHREAVVSTERVRSPRP
jgi:hypothetical protein